MSDDTPMLGFRIAAAIANGDWEEVSAACREASAADRLARAADMLGWTDAAEYMPGAADFLAALDDWRRTER